MLSNRLDFDSFAPKGFASRSSCRFCVNILLVANDPKVLVVIECAGVEPWLEIEEKAQRPILESWLHECARLIWISGTSDATGNHSLHPGVKLLRRQLKLTGRADSAPTRLIRYGVSKFNLHAIGEKKARDFFYGRFAGGSVKVEGPRVWLPVPTQIHIAGLRTIETFRYVIDNYDFDFAVRLSSTCLVRPNVLRQYVSSLPKQRVFGGSPVAFGATTFMSGASTIFSRDVIKGIVENERVLSLAVYEDVAISMLIHKLGLADNFDFPRIEVTSMNDLPDSVDKWAGVPVVRCKAQSPTRSAQLVIDNMVAVDEFLT